MHSKLCNTCTKHYRCRTRKYIFAYTNVGTYRKRNCSNQLSEALVCRNVQTTEMRTPPPTMHTCVCGLHLRTYIASTPLRRHTSAPKPPVLRTLPARNNHGPLCHRCVVHHRTRSPPRVRAISTLSFTEPHTRRSITHAHTKPHTHMHTRLPRILYITNTCTPHANSALYAHLLYRNCACGISWAEGNLQCAALSSPRREDYIETVCKSDTVRICSMSPAARDCSRTNATILPSLATHHMFVENRHRLCFWRFSIGFR